MTARRVDHRDRIARIRRRGQLLTGGPIGRDGHRVGTAAAVVGHLTAVQAQEHAFARWSVARRLAGTPPAATVDAEFERGDFLRTHVLRPTWHYVTRADLRWLTRLSGPRVLAANVGRCRDLGLDPATLSRANAVIAAAVDAGPRTRRELGAILEADGISPEGQRLAYLLMHAELTAVVCSGPMNGTQHTYAAFDHRVPKGVDLDDDEAAAELARRYFTTRGPATIRDFGWWSGLRAGEARRALDAVQPELQSMAADDRTYWFGPDDADGERAGRTAAGPPVDLVPRYDEIILSYTESRDVLQTEAVAFTPPTHIDGFHHVLLSGGRLLGQWRVDRTRTGPDVTVRLWRSATGPTEERAVARAVAAYIAFEAGPRRGPG